MQLLSRTTVTISADELKEIIANHLKVVSGFKCSPKDVELHIGTEGPYDCPKLKYARVDCNINESQLDLPKAKS